MQIIPIPFTQNLTAMNWLQNISITCFAASYAVVFALEISRIFFDVSFRKYVRVGFAAAGLFAVASSPALSALEHRRYDVWVIRCVTL